MKRKRMRLVVGDVGLVVVVGVAVVEWCVGGAGFDNAVVWRDLAEGVLVRGLLDRPKRPELVVVVVAAVATQGGVCGFVADGLLPPVESRFPLPAVRMRRVDFRVGEPLFSSGEEEELG